MAHTSILEYGAGIIGKRMKYLSVKNRAILREVIVTNFKVRYQGSMLGYLWSLLKPLFMFAILYIVFTQVFKVGDGIPHYPVYLLLGIVLWNFFYRGYNDWPKFDG